MKAQLLAASLRLTVLYAQRFQRRAGGAGDEELSKTCWDDPRTPGWYRDPEALPTHEVVCPFILSAVSVEAR